MNSCQFVLLKLPLLWQCLRGSDGGTSIVITVVRYKFVVPIYTGMTLPEKDTYTGIMSFFGIRLTRINQLLNYDTES